MGVFRDHIYIGMLFCDHTTSIEDTSLVKSNNNSDLIVICLLITTINILMNI